MLARLRTMLAHLWAMLAHLGAMWAQLAAMLAPLGPAWGHLRGYVGPSSSYVGPSWGAFWSLCWAMLAHLDPQDRKNWKATRHCKCGMFVGSVVGVAALLSYGEERRPKAVPQPQGLGAPGRM